MGSVPHALSGGTPVLAFVFDAAGRRIYWRLPQTRGDLMTNDTKNDDGSPKFGRLLLALLAAVVFCGVLTWVMGTYFPNFPG